MELKRDFYDELLRWAKSRPQQCLLVNGARQVGKTFIIEKFGRENYESFIEINFALEPECAAIFEGALDARSIRERLTARTSTNTPTPPTFPRSRTASARFPASWPRRTASSSMPKSRTGERHANTSPASNGSGTPASQRSPNASMSRFPAFPAT